MNYDQTMVQVRERSYLDIMDLALIVVRRHPVTLGVTAAAGFAPWVALNAWIFADNPNPFPLLWLLCLEIPWATAPLTVVLGGLMFGTRPRPRSVIVVLGTSLAKMFVYQFLLRGALLITVVASPLLLTRFAFLSEVILLERGEWRKVLRRSSDLASEQGTELFGRWLGQVFFGYLFLIGFRWGVETVLGLLTDGFSWFLEDPVDLGQAVLTFFTDLRGPIPTFGIWIAIGFFAVAQFLTYVDQRIRLEGWEVELRLRSVGAAMRQDDETW